MAKEVKLQTEAAKQPKASSEVQENLVAEEKPASSGVREPVPRYRISHKALTDALFYGHREYLLQLYVVLSEAVKRLELSSKEVLEQPEPIVIPYPLVTEVAAWASGLYNGDDCAEDLTFLGKFFNTLKSRLPKPLTG